MRVPLCLLISTTERLARHQTSHTLLQLVHVFFGRKPHSFVRDFPFGSRNMSLGHSFCLYIFYQILNVLRDIRLARALSTYIFSSANLTDNTRIKSALSRRVSPITFYFPIYPVLPGDFLFVYKASDKTASLQTFKTLLQLVRAEVSFRRFGLSLRYLRWSSSLLFWRPASPCACSRCRWRLGLIILVLNNDY